MGRSDTKRDPVVILEEAISSGIAFFQYREKSVHALTKNERYVLSKQLQNSCMEHNIPFIINDDIELAYYLKADGVHLGQNDTSIKSAKARLHEECIIGISTSTLKEAMYAEQQGADYIGVGPIYVTNTKEDAKKPIGLQTLNEISTKVNIPVVAIGGITKKTAKHVFKHGADAIAVISAITESDNLHKDIEEMKSDK